MAEKTYERRVLKPFKGLKEKNKVFVKGDKFTGAQDRVNELVEKGYLSGKEIKTMKEKKSEVQEKGLNEQSFEQLKKMADDKGLVVNGTGKDGAIKKVDYIEALKK